MAEKKVKVYFLDKPGFLSIGPAYFTNGKNKILREKLSDPPYTLLAYPKPMIKERSGGEVYDYNAEIKTGMSVYPICDVDMPSGNDSNKQLHSKVLKITTLPYEKYSELLKEVKRREKILQKGEREGDKMRKELEKSLTRRRIETIKEFDRGLVKLVKEFGRYS